MEISTNTEHGHVETERMGHARAFIVASVVVIAAAILLYQSLLHGHLSAIDEYDDGVYFGSSIDLLHGMLPYRDYSFLQPPLIAFWLLPAAAFSDIFGSGAGLELARFLVDLVTLLNVTLLGVLLRKRSPLQILFATGMMALAQGTVQASQTVLIEPFLVALCLCALLALVDGERLAASGGRVWLAGLLFGIAGATKLWAIFPFVVCLVLLWGGSERGHRLRFIFGAVLGFLTGVLPFAYGAPSTFVHDVILTQAQRGASGETIPFRLASMTGISGVWTLLSAHPLAGYLALMVLYLLFCAMTFLTLRAGRWSTWTPLERLGLGCSGAVGLSLFVAPAYYYHYPAFEAPFQALLLVTVGSRISALIATRRHPLGRRGTKRARSVIIAALLLLLGAGDLWLVHATSPYDPVPASLVSSIPARGCILSNVPTVMILAGRFTSDRPGCPAVIDWNGEERVLVSGSSGVQADNRSLLMQRLILSWLRSSTAVVLGTTDAGIGRVARAYLHRAFVGRYFSASGVTVYTRKRVART